MAFENGEAGETFFRLELEDDGSSVKSEEPLEQVEGNTESEYLGPGRALSARCSVSERCLHGP